MIDYQREKEDRETQEWLKDKIVCTKCGHYVDKYADFCAICKLKEEGK